MIILPWSERRSRPRPVTGHRVPKAVASRILRSLVSQSWRLTGELSISQRQGIISLIPKKNKDPLLLKNWRPLSLLNTDYKLATKCIARLLEKVLPLLIERDETGYVKGRHIGENICLITDKIEQYENKESMLGVANGKIRALPRRRDPSLKIRARDLNLFVKSEPETHLIRKQFNSQTIVVGYP